MVPTLGIQPVCVQTISCHVYVSIERVETKFPLTSGTTCCAPDDLAAKACLMAASRATSRSAPLRVAIIKCKARNIVMRRSLGGSWQLSLRTQHRATNLTRLELVSTSPRPRENAWGRLSTLPTRRAMHSDIHVSPSSSLSRALFGIFAILGSSNTTHERGAGREFHLVMLAATR